MQKESHLYDVGQLSLAPAWRVTLHDETPGAGLKVAIAPL